MARRVAAAGRRGVAMLIVLWVILVLSLLISGFAFTMHVETQVASFGRKELKAEMLARSGVEVARMQLVLAQKSPTDAGFDAPSQPWATNEDLYVDHQLGNDTFTGTYNVKVTDEESKLPVNRASQEQLKRLLDLLEVDPSDQDVIVDSILDWIDDNDAHKLNGAEDEYYESLSPPYKAKNAPVDRVEELLLVRGVTRELMYGAPAKEDEPAKPGLIDLLTATSSGQINVNTASSFVLQALLGMDESQVQLILNRRDGADGLMGTDDDQPFRSIGEFTALLGGVDEATRTQVSQLLTVKSAYFTVKSVGEVAGVKRTVLATLRRDNTDISTVAWREMRGAL